MMSVLDQTHLLLLKKHILNFDNFPLSLKHHFPLWYKTLTKMLAIPIGKKKKNKIYIMSGFISNLHHVQCNAQGGMDSKNVIPKPKHCFSLARKWLANLFLQQVCAHQTLSTCNDAGV